MAKTTSLNHRQYINESQINLLVKKESFEIAFDIP